MTKPKHLVLAALILSGCTTYTPEQIAEIMDLGARPVTPWGAETTKLKSRQRWSARVFASMAIGIPSAARITLSGPSMLRWRSLGEHVAIALPLHLVALGLTPMPARKICRLCKRE